MTKQSKRQAGWSRLAVLAFSMVFCVGAMAAKPQIARNHWIVELDDAPTLEYRGVESALAADRSSAGMPAKPTAPGWDGSVRFNPHASHVQDYIAFLDAQRGNVLARAREQLQRELEPRAIYRHTMNGFAARMSSEEALKLAAMPGVRSVQPVMIHQLQLRYGPELIGARDLAAGMSGLSPASGEGTVVGVIDSGINADHQAFSDNSSMSGISFTNPYGSGRGLCSRSDVNCNNKLVGVFDFTTEGTNGLDNDGHGTHVAATAAGVDWAEGLAGVAPAANIVSWKACYLELPEDFDNAGEPGCVSSAFLQAFESAIELGVDVVNFSIGGQTTVSPWAAHYGRQILNLWQAGIPFVTSAGNTGPGPATITFPAYMPWAFAVGSSTHKVNSFFRIVHNTGAFVIVYGDGPPLTAPPISNTPMLPGDAVGGTMLGCEPFPNQAFANSIALLKRGDCLFSEKVENAENAGARAVVMINNVPGDPIVMAGLEDTGIPSGMISATDGQAALDLIDAQGELRISMPINPVQVTDPSLQDRVSGFSARGPSVVDGVLKPNVVAPGQRIEAAFVPGTSSVATISGTSMASPHVAGAIAQLRQLNPTWGPDALQSVLETTAEVEPVTFAGAPATLFDRGSGRVRVDLAARAGLFLPVTFNDFIAASPADGGDPATLNLSGVLFENCDGSCTLTRTVEALSSGSWTVQTTGELDISVSPASFNLGAGQRQTLEITVTGSGSEGGGLATGEILLIANEDNMSDQRLQVGAVFGESTPAESVVSVSIEANRGRGTLTVGDVPTLPEAVFNTSALVKPIEEHFELAQDPTDDDPFSGGEGTKTFLVEVPEGTLLLWAETASDESPDIDLFVGFDANGDGQASESELVCVSWEFMESSERCLISNPEPGTWWIVVQNWLASSDEANDAVSLEYAVLADNRSDYSLVASGIGNHPGGSLELQVHWDDPSIRFDERRLGAIGISSVPNELADVGVIPVSLTRSQNYSPLPTALFPDQPYDVIVPASTEHNQLFIDVPPSAHTLTVEVQGNPDMEVALSRFDFSELGPHAPGTPSAGGVPLILEEGSEDTITLVWGSEADPLEPGRYYVRLGNLTDSEQIATVKAAMTEVGRTEAQYGLWSPQSRLIFQGIEWQRAGPGFMLWYSYDHAGLPQFYIATADIDENSSVWRATLERVTGNNVRQNVQVVGEISLTVLDDDLMSFAWRLNGAHGSELVTPDAPQTCREVDGEPFSLTGHWFSPGNPVGGTTMIITADNQSYVRYYYDHDGVGRWVFVSAIDDELGAAGEVRDFRGFCPNCDPFPMTYDENSTAVGAYGVSFDSDSTGTEVIDFTNASPLNHDISLDVPIQKLSERLSCE